MQSALLGAQAIKSGEAQVVLVGGTESMTQSPFLLARPGKGETLHELDHSLTLRPVDILQKDSWICVAAMIDNEACSGAFLRESQTVGEFSRTHTQVKAESKFSQ